MNLEMLSKHKPWLTSSKNPLEFPIKKVWELYVDGSATRQGAGGGVVLISPEKDELEFAVRFQFRASNNEVRYEELLQGLRLAERAGAKHLLV